MAERRTPTVTMPDELIEEIDSQLDYGDSRAAWIREACRQRLEREELSDAESHEVPAEN